jgi:Flp pilus assembly protein TadG
MRSNFMRPILMCSSFMRRLVRDRCGNVAIIFALSLIPIVFLTGMAMDFTSAISKRVRLDAAADAAALAAVTPTMMGKTDATAKTTAQNIFNGTSAGIPGTTSVTSTVTITDSNGGLTRTVTVSYTANSMNAFPAVLQLGAGKSEATWPLAGSSTATASASPNINFYLLLDNSPSMDLPATSAGITAMNNATANAPSNGANAGGCAFACHESNPAADNLGNPNGEDNYALAQNLGVVTRIQNMVSATQALMTTATSTEAQNNAAYEMAIYTFNGTNGGASRVQSLTSSLTTAANAASNINVLEVYDNNYLTSSNDNSDTDTDFATAMSQMNTTMPTPGTGTTGGSPQEVLFIVTDGVEDKISSSCTETTVSTSGGSRCQQPFDTTWCTTIKNRGIRIAVLYTEYLPLPASGTGSNSWYNSYVSPYQTSIGPNMQSCASTGLYFAITTNGDISTAMQNLFDQAVATARLTQ